MIKTLLKEVKEYKKDTLLSPVYVSIEAILEVLIPFLMAILVDNGIEKGNSDEINLVLWLFDVGGSLCIFVGWS